MFQLNFINTNPDMVKNPIVVVELNKVDSWGKIIPWIKNEMTIDATIDKAVWNYDRTECRQPSRFSYLYEMGIIPNVIPDNNVLKDSRGTYQMTVTVYNADKSLVLSWISWQVNIV
jgi:hypothetical protein